MTLKSKPYFWVECDWPGCGTSAQEGSDYTAMGDPGSAQETAADADWWLSPNELLDYCDSHPMVWSSDDERPEPPYLLIHDGDEGYDDNTVTLVATP